MKKNTILALLAITLFVGFDTKGMSLGKASTASSNRNRTTAPNRTSTRASSAVNRSAISRSAINRSAVSKGASAMRSAVSKGASAMAPSKAAAAAFPDLSKLPSIFTLDRDIKEVTNFASTAASKSTLAADNTGTIISNQKDAATKATTDTTTITGAVAGVKGVVDGNANKLNDIGTVVGGISTDASTAATKSTLAADNTGTIISNQKDAATKATTDTNTITGAVSDVKGVADSIASDVANIKDTALPAVKTVVDNISTELTAGTGAVKTIKDDVTTIKDELTAGTGTVKSTVDSIATDVTAIKTTDLPAVKSAVTGVQTDVASVKTGVSALTSKLYSTRSGFPQDAVVTLLQARYKKPVTGSNTSLNTALGNLYTKGYISYDKTGAPKFNNPNITSYTNAKSVGVQIDSLIPLTAYPGLKNDLKTVAENGWAWH